MSAPGVWPVAGFPPGQSAEVGVCVCHAVLYFIGKTLTYAHSPVEAWARHTLYVSAMKLKQRLFFCCTLTCTIHTGSGYDHACDSSRDKRVHLHRRQHGTIDGLTISTLPPPPMTAVALRPLVRAPQQRRPGQPLSCAARRVLAPRRHAC